MTGQKSPASMYLSLLVPVVFVQSSLTQTGPATQSHRATGCRATFFTTENLSTMSELPIEQRPLRCVVYVRKIHNDRVQVEVPRWRPGELVTLPSSAIPPRLWPNLVRGRILLAEVNAGAKVADALWFQKLELTEFTDTGARDPNLERALLRRES